MARAVATERPAITSASTGRRHFRPEQALLYLALIVVALVFIVPLFWLFSTALKTEAEIFGNPSGLIPAEPTLANFENILGPQSDAPVLQWFLNSLVTALLGTVLTLILASLSAYAFARIDFPGKGVLFGVLVSTLVIPGVMFLVGQYQVIIEIGNAVNNTPLAEYFGFNRISTFILPGLAGVFGVFFLRQFFLSIPVELEEAAYVDGASRLRTFLSIIVPISGPALATLATITFLAYWNDYLWPLINCQEEGCTLTPGLRNLQGQNTFEFGILMAGAAIAAIPVLIFYVIAQRWIVQSVASTGVKG
jgi:multiple sugar transport system permease protein